MVVGVLFYFWKNFEMGDFELLVYVINIGDL